MAFSAYFVKALDQMRAIELPCYTWVTSNPIKKIIITDVWHIRSASVKLNSESYRSIIVKIKIYMKWFCQFKRLGTVRVKIQIIPTKYLIFPFAATRNGS